MGGATGGWDRQGHPGRLVARAAEGRVAGLVAEVALLLGGRSVTGLAVTRCIAQAADHAAGGERGDVGLHLPLVRS